MKQVVLLLSCLIQAIATWPSFGEAAAEMTSSGIPLDTQWKVAVFPID